MTKIAPIWFFLLLARNAQSENFNKVVKCCKPGWELSKEQDFQTSLSCVRSKGGKENKLRISIPEESLIKTKYDEITSPKMVCGGLRINKHGPVEEIFPDGFVFWKGHERPYSCVDFKESTTNELTDTRESTKNDSLVTFSKNEQKSTSKKEENIQYAVFCSPAHQMCGQGEVCVDKCCRGSKVLQTSPNEKLECVASNGSEWNSENLKLQLGVESLNIRSWLFYLKRNLKVCSKTGHKYRTVQGRVEVVQEDSHNVITSFCIDNLKENIGGQLSEVIVTRMDDCSGGGVLSGAQEEEVPMFEKVILTIIAPASLLCLVLTGIAYLIFPSPPKQWAKDKIVLINVVFTGLFCALYILFHFTNPLTFQLECPQFLCRLTRDYMCTFLGYFTYFVLMSNFSWITVFGFDLYLSIHKMVQRDPGWKQNIGLSVQLPSLPIIFFLVLYVSSLSLSDGKFLISHHVALSSLVTSIFGIFLLFLDLLRNCRDEDGNRGGNINCIVGLGIPLLLTATMASLHLLLPKGSLLNPEVGEQDQCVVIAAHPAARFLILYHLPIFSIVLVNLAIFLQITREVFGIRCSITRNMQYGNAELKKQMLLYIKIFTVFGLTWSLEPLGTILALLQLPGLARVIATFANILNLLRGVFIFAIFAPSQVQKWLHRRQNPAPPGTRQSSRMISMQTVETRAESKG